MWTYETARGRTIDLGQLGERELDIVLGLIALAGGWDALRGNDGGRAELDPPTLRSAAEAWVRQRFKGAFHGCSHELVLVIEDLIHRAEQQPGAYERGDWEYDPTHFLYLFYHRNCRTIREFAQAVGLSNREASKFVRRETNLSINQVKKAAERTGHVFTVEKVGATPPRFRLRDRLAFNAGIRLQALWTAARNGLDRETLEAAVKLELNARFELKGEALEAALRTLEINSRKTESVHDSTLLVIYLEPYLSRYRKNAKSLAWLFLAVDLGWFDETETAVALVPNRPPHEDSGLDIRRLTSPGTESFLSVKDWRFLYAEALQHQINPPRESESGTTKQRDLGSHLATYRELGDALIDDEMTGPFARQTVERWHAALRDQLEDISVQLPDRPAWNIDGKS